MSPSVLSTDPQPAPWRRRAVLLLAVAALHGAALWALHSGLSARRAEPPTPATVLAELLPPQPPTPPAQRAPAPGHPAPAPTTTPQPTPRPAAPKAPAVVRSAPPPAVPPTPAPAAAPAPAPAPLPVAATSTAAAADLAPSAPSPAAPASPPAAPVAAASSPASAPAAPASGSAAPAPAPSPQVQLPDSRADYLHNRPPPYPALSRRLGEQGKVIVRAYIDIDGKAKQAEVRQSSGYERLDRAAVQTVLEWTYIPGKVNGEPRAMWFNIPIHFVLDP